MPSKWKETQLKCHAFGTQKNPCPCLYKGKKIKNRKEQFKENTVFFSLHPTLRLCIFFFLSSREGRGEDDKDYGKIYIKRARNFMSLREKSLNIEKNQRMFKFKLILMERILYNLILILILE